MTPARKIVKGAQALAEAKGFDFIAEGFRDDGSGFWEKQARQLIFQGLPSGEASKALYELAVLAVK